MPKVRINYDHSEDFDWEQATVYVDGKRVAGILTSSDCPEDNNISRMDVIGGFKALAKALGVEEVELTEESEEE